MKTVRSTTRRPIRLLGSLVCAALGMLPIVSCGNGHAHGAGFALELTPAVASIASGTEVQLVAMALYPDGAKSDVTSNVAWSSSDASVATVSSSGGLVAGLVPGTAIIEALFSGVRATTQLTVTSAILASIEITPPVPSIAKAATLQLTATGVFTDASTQDLTQQVAWASSDELVATFAGSAGLATGVAVGNATISATFSGVSGATVLEITPATLSAIEITPPAPQLPKGTALQLTAMGIFSDGTLQDLTTQATWQSGDPAVAAVSDAEGTKGRVEAADVGQAAISATLLGVSGAASVAVTPATLGSIAVEPATPTLAKGLQLQFSATGTFSDGTTEDLTAQAIWESSDPAVCALSNAPGSEGQALALEIGSAIVSARLAGQSGATQLSVTDAALVSIAVEPALPTLVETLQLQFTASGSFSDGSTQDLTEQVTWGSSDAAIAVVSNESGSKGSSTALAAGSAVVSAKFLGLTGATTLTVVEAQLVSIEVTPAQPTIAKGTALPFLATGLFSDGSHQDVSTQVTWSSSDGTVAAVSNAGGSQGLVTGLAVGTSTISAELAGTIGSTVLAVSAATLVSIEVTPPAPTIANGTSLQFAATGVYTDASTADLSTQVSWSCSSAAVASISNAAGTQGRAKGQGVGSATISALFAGVSGSTTLGVSAATLQSIEIQPRDASIPRGTALQFHATGVYSDATIIDITDQVTWTSSDQALAAIANAPATPGHATGVNQGSATIGASLAGVSDSTMLTVADAALVSVAVTPADVALPLGTTGAFAALATFTDGSVQDVTAAVTWVSSSSGIATVSNAPASAGVASAHALGSAAIGALFQGISGSANLTVTDAVLASLAVTPANPSTYPGQAVQFVATGTYSDSSTLDLTALVAWSSSNAAIATVSNASDHGRSSGVAPGSALIAATLQGHSGSTLLTVSPQVLVSIDLAPLAPAVPKSFQWQFVATGHFSDGSTQDYTSLVAWASSDSSRATISNAAGSNGLATCANPGTCTISFAYQSFFGSTSLSVTQAKPVSTAISPSPLNLAVGQTQQLTAITTFDDGTVMDVTRQRDWTSSHIDRVTVGDSSTTKGLVTALKAGQSDVQIHVGGLNTTVHVTVQ